jgi:hypothetical protein
MGSTARLPPTSAEGRGAVEASRLGRSNGVNSIVMAQILAPAAIPTLTRRSGPERALPAMAYRELDTSPIGRDYVAEVRQPRAS